MKETDGKAAKRERGDCFPTADGENGRYLCTEGEELRRVEKAGSLEKEMLIEKRVPEFCLLFAEIALQPVIRGEKN